MYAKCGVLSKAQEVFDELPSRSVVSWNTLILGYTQYGLGHEALHCFEQMQHEGLSPDSVTFTCALKACSSIGAAEQGRKIHDDIIRRRLINIDIFLGNTLVDMYAKCGALAKAQQLFDELPLQDIVTWNALIAGYCEHGHNHAALKLFQRMKRTGIAPDDHTFICILKVCKHIGVADIGEEIHDMIVRQGLLAKDVVIGNALMDMYAICGALAKAQEVFDELPVQNVASWNALIAGCAQDGDGCEALNYLKIMLHQGLSPNAVTFTCALRASMKSMTVKDCQEMHAEVVKQGLLEKDTILGTALVDMYVKCGVLVRAKELFNKLPDRNVVTWGALIAEYAEHEHGCEVLTCFDQMQNQGLYPNAVTFSCVLKACGSIGGLEKGEEIHAEIVKQGLLYCDAILSTALANMYARCGMLDKARGLVEDFPVPVVAAWNALITAYIQHGGVHKALHCFQRMQQRGLSSDAITITCALEACGSLGAVEKGEDILGALGHGLVRKDAAFGTALVSMYAKRDKLVKAKEVFDNFPVRDVVVWSALITG